MITILSPVAFRRHPLNQKTINELDDCGEVVLFEVHGISEVSRARNAVATNAVEHVRENGGMVLWLDADMTAPKGTIRNLAQASLLTNRAISGRAVMRSDPLKVAASLEESTKREEYEQTIGTTTIRLSPILAGLGCLMMPAQLFLDQIDRSPKMFRPDGRVEFLVCCPLIEQHPTMGHVFVSEDHAYSRTIDGGAWLARATVGSEVEWFDFGHVVERVALHDRKDSVVRGDLLK